MLAVRVLRSASLTTLPAGVLDVTGQLRVDADYLVIRGAGADPATGTRFVFRPDENTRYDGLTKDGNAWDPDEMGYESGNGGWLWPGRGLFRVQSAAVHEDYREDYESAPANRRDLFEGSVNVHWKAGGNYATRTATQGSPRGQATSSSTWRARWSGTTSLSAATSTSAARTRSASTGRRKRSPASPEHAYAPTDFRHRRRQPVRPHHHRRQAPGVRPTGDLHFGRFPRDRQQDLWSASNNVVTANDFDTDPNLHGGWERRNLFEQNTARVPFEHSPGNCRTNCGGEGGAETDESTWYPIWWGAGAKAVKWSARPAPRTSSSTTP
ncbi:hypothetical protein SAMN05216174_11584 [Actinokineospora iranica]|uniref:Uncharacterized protein n=1 Tax=Actinokineospora iranica TaxID=1271860 RepID=A0A1G6WP87_9PSEU|nr:hypothetical protein SAMN05216174_11584 [Actinokineospora iranica]